MTHMKEIKNHGKCDKQYLSYSRDIASSKAGSFLVHDSVRFSLHLVGPGISNFLSKNAV
jgi:hypothetical protein